MPSQQKALKPPEYRTPKRLSEALVMTTLLVAELQTFVRAEQRENQKNGGHHTNGDSQGPRIRR